MKVRAVRKTIGNYNLSEFKRAFPGGEFIIKKVGLDQVYSDGHFREYMFVPSDLEPVEERYICERVVTGTCNTKSICGCQVPHERSLYCDRGCSQGNKFGLPTPVKCIPYQPKEATMPKEYESVKEITLEEMERAGAVPSCEDYKRFAQKAIEAGYGTINVIPTTLAMSWAKTDFLVTKGFVREKKTCLRTGEMSVGSYTDARISQAPALFYKRWGIAMLTEQGLMLCKNIPANSVPFPLDAQGRIRVVE